MDTAYHSPIDIDGISKRKQEGPWQFSNAGPVRKSCSPLEDTLLTVGTFLLAMVAPVSFLVWMFA